MPSALVSRVGAALAYRRAKAHLLTAHRRGYGDVRQALDVGVPMNLLVDVHDAVGDADCSYEYGPANRAFQDVRHFVGAGGDPAQIARLLDATPRRRGSVQMDLHLFVAHSQRAQKHGGAWAKSRDWAEEYLAYIESGHYPGNNIHELLPIDLSERYRPFTEQWKAMVSIADAYAVEVPDLAQYIPALQVRENDGKDWRGWAEVWRPLALWLGAFGPERTRLLHAAGLTLDEGFEIDADDQTLSMMAALRTPAAARA